VNTVAETAKSREDRSPRVSPHGSADRFVHNYSDTHVNEETNTLRLGTSGDQSWRAMTNVNTEVVQPSSMHRSAHRSPTATRPASLSRSIQRVNVEAEESSIRGSDWTTYHTSTSAGSRHSEKTNHQKRVEVKDLKIVATRERKARAAAKKRERKRQCGDGGEGSRPATKRKNTIARKDGPVASGATSQYFEFLGTRVPFSTFLLAVIRHFRVHIS
nr:hypothetical protein [Tanacetum cinerariifolium]